MPDNRAARVPARRADRRRELSQNFLVDRASIERLVRGAGVGQDDLTVDIGAGNGLITAALARRGARVIAVEQDPVLARRLREKFDAEASGEVTVVAGDVLGVPLPGEPFQVVANIPFGITTKILHYLLDDPGNSLRRADLVVQAEVARKRGSGGRGTLLNACWGPWFEFRTGPRMPAGAFRPRPRVDGAILMVRRREPPLLEAALSREYARFVTAAFGDAHPTVASGVARVLPRSRFAGVAGSLGFRLDALPSQLDAAQWAGVFLAARR
jgi:23S rRNA (adenine-N6)-dimethyltransferase